MAQQIFAVRGTADCLTDQTVRWQYAEKQLQEICARFGYREIRLPTFEYTELFARGVGDTTDVVGKEMYTFTDKGNRSVTLRPEGTAGVVRSVLEHGLLGGVLPLRAYYLMSCFRYEKPQAGRLREYHTLGIELLGSAQPDADVEVIAVADSIFKHFKIDNIKLMLNSIGCPECRKNYRTALVDFLKQREEMLCETCKQRLQKNPLRVLDCKSPECHKACEGSPVILDYLCGECSEHFEQVKQLLGQLGIQYEIDPHIVRGLDYYTRTVFEFVHSGEGYSGTVCGGGRYDGLVEILGGKPTPAVGFGMGMERLVAILEATAAESLPLPATPQIFIGYIGDSAKAAAARLVHQLRALNIAAEYDISGRSLKAQLKYADKTGAQHSLVLGDNELATQEASLKNMTNGTETNVRLQAAEICKLL